MRKTGFLLIVALSFLAALAAAAAEGSGLRLIKARGTVNKSEIGGKGLCVFSLWDKARGTVVGEDGGFVTVISDSRPQKLSVKDQRQMTRALAIALPENWDRINFDAASTAVALLFEGPDLFRSSGGAKKLCLAMAGKKSFQELALFLKKNLPLKSLEELATNAECSTLLGKCSDEVFKEDRAAIRKSLSVAKDKLEKLLP